MKLKVKKINITVLIFLLAIAIYCFTTEEGNKGGSSSLKYIVLMIGLISSGVYYWARKKKPKFFLKETKYLLLLVGIIMISTIIVSISVGSFTFRTVQELIFLVVPMVYSFLLLNTLNNDEIETLFKWTLIISFVAYIIVNELTLSKIYRGLLGSDFNSSYSELESSVFCGLALSTAMYFIYTKKNIVWKIFSILFVLMTFKRLFMLMTLILLIASFFKKQMSKEVPRFIFIITFLLLTAILLIYYVCLLPQNVEYLEGKYGIDLSKLTMTRSDRLKELMGSSYSTYGFGSSTEYMYDHFYGALEMDLIKIGIEVGFHCSIVLIFSYLNYGRRTGYTFLIMIFQILNLVVSSGLTGTFSWCLIFILVAAISRRESTKERLSYEI